jgi:glucosamine--fructose-6-phosphate aminotransferase (isomerizing)
VEEIEYNLEEIEKGGYDHFMMKEINEQAHTISSTFLDSNTKLPKL